MSRKNDIENLITKNTRRLQKLREKQASYGLDTPVHILIEIEEVEAKLEKLKSQLDAVKDTDVASSDKSPIPPDGTGGCLRIYAAYGKAGFILMLLLLLAIAAIFAVNKFLPSTNSATPTPFIIDTMETLDWEQYGDNKGSSIVLRSKPGIADNAVEIAFELEPDGYVGISKVLDPGILSGTDGIKFSYNGSGAPNTIEIKLLYAPDSKGRTAVFSASRHHITATDGWQTFEVLYSQFGCWIDTGCAYDEKIDLKKVWKIDFAISNKLGDTPGVGIVAIENIEGITLR